MKDLLDMFGAQFEQPKQEEPEYGKMSFISAMLAYIKIHGEVLTNQEFRVQIWDPAQKALQKEVEVLRPGGKVFTPEVEDKNYPIEVKGQRPAGLQEAMINNGVITAPPEVDLSFKVKSPEDNKPEPIKIEIEVPVATGFEVEPLTDDKGQASLFDSSFDVSDRSKEMIKDFVDDLRRMSPLEFEREYMNSPTPVVPDDATIKGDFVWKKEATEEVVFEPNENGRFTVSTPMLSKALQQSEAVPPVFAAGIDPYQKDGEPGEVTIFKNGIPVIPQFGVEREKVNFREELEINENTRVKIDGQDYIEFTVLGDPTAQKRHKHRVIPGTKFTQQYDPSAGDKADFLAIVQKWAPQQPLQGPVRLDIMCYFSRPKNHYRSGKNSHILKDDAPKWHISRPDADNLEKFIKDALKGVYWKDDSQICLITCLKQYDNDMPRTIVQVSRP